MIRTASRWLLLGAVLLGAGCAEGGLGGGGPVTGPPGTPPPGPDPFLAGLIGAAAGANEVRVDWRLPATGFEAALFQAQVEADVFAGPPVVEGLLGDGAVFAGLPEGVELFLGLGVRPDTPAGGGPYVPAGTILRVTTRAPIYVDAAADPGVADGSTPATAFPDLFSAFLTAAFLGGGNVWVRDGEYLSAALPLSAGVDVYGGFQAGFDLADRDVRQLGTELVGQGGLGLLSAQGGDPGVIVDGLRILGNGRSSIGFDGANTPAELRSVGISGCTSRGIRLRNDADDPVDVRVVACFASLNGADGLSLLGPFHLVVEGSRFEGNVQEGMDLDDLVAPEGGAASLTVRGSAFVANGTQGLDVDLAAPAITGPLGGTFEVTVEGSRFELNGEEGLLIDIDYELDPGWSAEIVVRESVARANAGQGIRIDADAPASVVLHRILASANAGDGLEVSSESDPGLVLVATSVFSGNLGAGVRASLGNRTVVAGHCILAGNEAGGLVSELVDASATSCVAYLQPDPWQGTRVHFGAEVDDPLAGAFETAPEGYAGVLSVVGSQVKLAGGASVAPGSALELADDGMLLVAQSMSGSTVVVDPAPEFFLAPGSLSIFGPAGPTSAVDEDYHLPPGSPAEGAGMTPPGGPPVDAGVWSSPTAGAPGAGDELAAPLFRPIATTPALASGLPSLDPLEVSFSDDLDPASLALDAVRAVTASGAVIPIAFFAVDETLVVSPTGGGWGAEPFLLELHAAISSSTGAPICAPVALPVTPF